MNNKKMHIFLHNKTDKKILTKIKDEVSMFSQFYILKDNELELSVEQRKINGILDPILITNSNYLSILYEEDFEQYKSQIEQFYQVKIVNMKDTIEEVIEQIFDEFFMVSNIDEKKIKETMKSVYGREIQ